jgi:hypothetical protein
LSYQAVADVEREIMKALEKQYMEILMPLRDGIPEKIEKQVRRITRQYISPKSGRYACKKLRSLCAG